MEGNISQNKNGARAEIAIEEPTPPRQEHGRLSLDLTMFNYVVH